MRFFTDKELFNYVRNFPPDSVQSLKELFSKYLLEEVSIDYILENIYRRNDILLIDARTEFEFEETFIPASVNFPILNTEERHYVGLVYKKYSSTAAVKLAMEFADPKSEKLKEFLSLKRADEKEIIVYCWRGGGRSKYLATMISDLGYKCRILTGGIKSYRRKVNELWEISPFPYGIIELSGMTGAGKTDILKKLSESTPVIDLEKAARHFSSLFGYVPYFIQLISPVMKQSAFENSVFAQIIRGRNSNNFRNLFFIESESKKVGDFFIPDSLFDKMQISPCILVLSTTESRIKRIVNDYFGVRLQGLKPMMRIFKEKEKFFRKELSNKLYDKLLTDLENGEVYEFTEIMLTEYYDKKYKVKPKTPVLTVNSDDMVNAVSSIKEYYSKNCN
jgi:tRNA 2-selenouridine synthase